MSMCNREILVEQQSLAEKAQRLVGVCRLVRGRMEDR
jgi:hypothetical protein